MAEYISGSEEAFVQRMNETARELGMTAEYENSHGAHVHYLTARSQAILVREFIQRYPQILDYTSLTGVSFNGKWYPNTNKLLPGLDYAYEGADGFKTGTITAAGYCLSATRREERQAHHQRGDEVLQRQNPPPPTAPPCWTTALHCWSTSPPMTTWPTTGAGRMLPV